MFLIAKQHSGYTRLKPECYLSLSKCYEQLLTYYCLIAHYFGFRETAEAVPPNLHKLINKS